MSKPEETWAVYRKNIFDTFQYASKDPLPLGFYDAIDAAYLAGLEGVAIEKAKSMKPVIQILAVLLGGALIIMGVGYAHSKFSPPLKSGYYWIGDSGCWAYAPFTIRALEEAKKDCLNYKE